MRRVTSPDVPEPPPGLFSNCLVVDNVVHISGQHAGTPQGPVGGVGRKRWQSEWAFSLYNVYGRENAFSISFREDPNDPSRTQALQTALFRWVPSVSYNFKFK